MIWLQSPPWGRWLLAILIAAVAVWVEVKPDATVEHPFAAAEIPSGTRVADASLEWRRVPAGTFEAIDLDSVTSRTVHEGEPLLASSIEEDTGVVPQGWWVIETDVPDGARPGDRARLVMLDSGVSVDAYIVATPSDDPFDSTPGSVAIDPAFATEAATAAAQGRIAVMIETG